MTMQASAIQPPGDLRAALSRAESRRKWRAFSLTLPLLVFLLLTLLVPIAALLMRAVENPEVAKALPTTVEALADWDRTSQPPSGCLRGLGQRFIATARHGRCRRLGAPLEL